VLAVDAADADVILRNLADDLRILRDGAMSDVIVSVSGRRFSLHYAVLGAQDCFCFIVVPTTRSSLRVFTWMNR